MPASPRVLIAPDKFKGTLDAVEAASAISAGIRTVRSDAQIMSLPVADGGEGTVDALVAIGGVAHEVRVRGPLEQMTTARFATLNGTAFIESAQACGLPLVNPDQETSMAAHSYGVGELLRAALDLECSEIIVGLGGVACTDGGSGMVAALGARLLDDDGVALPLGGSALTRLAQLDLSGLDPRLRSARLVAACDVSNPLTGPEGAAAVFGPQKGAGPREVDHLDRALARLAQVLSQEAGTDLAREPGSGAAGGLAAGFVGFLDSEVSSGAELVLAMIGLEDQLRHADLVITGEGKLDRQSLSGKAPVAVARLAQRHGVPAIALAGFIEPAAQNELRAVFAHFASMVDHTGAEQALSRPATVLRELTESVARTWLNTVQR